MSSVSGEKKVQFTCLNHDETKTERQKYFNGIDKKESHDINLFQLVLIKRSNQNNLSQKRDQIRTHSSVNNNRGFLQMQSKTSAFIDFKNKLINCCLL